MPKFAQVDIINDDGVVALELGIEGRLWLLNTSECIKKKSLAMQVDEISRLLLRNENATGAPQSQRKAPFWYQLSHIRSESRLGMYALRRRRGNVSNRQTRTAML